MEFVSPFFKVFIRVVARSSGREKDKIAGFAQFPRDFEHIKHCSGPTDDEARVPDRAGFERLRDHRAGLPEADGGFGLAVELVGELPPGKLFIAPAEQEDHRIAERVQSGERPFRRGRDRVVNITDAMELADRFEPVRDAAETVWKKIGP